MIVLVWSFTISLHGITIEIRRMCDHGGTCESGDFFFDNPEALDALRFATRAFEPFSDSLLAIPSTPGWTATFENPDNGLETVQLQNLSVPANTLILYAGGYDMPENQVGEAGPGKTPSFTLNRGSGIVAGPVANDFTPWGGAIAFDTQDNGTPRNWHFGINTNPGPGQSDFLTIAFHELAHVFGFGTAPSFDNLISNDRFQGAATIQLTQSTVSMAAGGDHWASGTTSPPFADPPLSALTASLVLGRRRILTPLDYAALADLGWQVPNKLLGLHGDIDADGHVGGRDFLRWQRSFGNTGVGLLADADGSLKVDDYDLWLWQTNFGRQVASNGPFSAVPEPSTFLLVFLNGISFLSRRPLRLLSRYR